jgi:hypothetical protein
MENAGTERAKGTRNRLGGGAKRPANAKKILNRGNEPKDLLKTKDLAFSGAQNELFFECKKARSKRKKSGCAQTPEQDSGIRIPGVRTRDPEVKIQEAEERGEGYRGQGKGPVLNCEW